MLKLERTSGTIFAVGCICFTLLLKSLFSGDNADVISFSLVSILIVIPSIAAYIWKPEKSKS